MLRPQLRGTARPIGAGLLVALLATSLRADTQPLKLATTVPDLGGSTTLTVRNANIGAAVIIATDVDLGPMILPGMPINFLGAGQAVAGMGVIDATGRFELTLPTPSAGSVSYAQAFLMEGAQLVSSNYVTIIPGQTQVANFVDETVNIDPVTALFSANDADWTDVDKDGCPDVIVSNDGPGARPLILMGDCSGGLFDESLLRLPQAALVPSATIEVADVNNDTWPDLFIGGGHRSSSPSPNQLFLNDRTGHFIAAGRPQLPGGSGAFGGCRPSGACEIFGLPPGKGVAVDAEFGDVDGDGDLDLLVINVADQDHPSEISDPVTLYINQGGMQGGQVARFLANTSFSSLPDNSAHGGNGDASLADADNDGDLDILVVALGIQNQLYVNDGSGNFTDVTATALPAEIDNTQEAEFGDFDGDGDLDIFAANSIASDPSAIHYYENVTVTPGSPLFIDSSSNIPASLGLVTDVRQATAVGDIDNDGDLDIFVAIHELPGPGGTNGEAVLLLNQGGAQGGTQGEFVVDTMWLPGLFIDSDIALGDFDVDGDLDVYIANSGNLFQFDFHDELWRNNL